MISYLGWLIFNSYLITNLRCNVRAITGNYLAEQKTSRRESYKFKVSVHCQRSIKCSPHGHTVLHKFWKKRTKKRHMFLLAESVQPQVCSFQLFNQGTTALSSQLIALPYVCFFFCAASPELLIFLYQMSPSEPHSSVVNQVNHIYSRLYLSISYVIIISLQSHIIFVQVQILNILLSHLIYIIH